MDPAAESNQLMIDTWKTFCNQIPTGSVSESDGGVASLGNTPLAFFNVCFHKSSFSKASDLARMLTAAKALANKCPHPWFFALCHELAPEGWSQVAEEQGFQVGVRLAGMATDRLLLPRRECPRLDYSRVKDLRGAKEIADLNCIAYGRPL